MYLRGAWEDLRVYIQTRAHYYTEQPPNLGMSGFTLPPIRGDSIAASGDWATMIAVWFAGVNDESVIIPATQVPSRPMVNRQRMLERPQTGNEHVATP